MVEFGGFLGLGEERRIVPLSAMSLREDRIILPGVTEAEFRALPAWRGDAGYRELENTYAAPFRTYAAVDNRHRSRRALITASSIT